MDLTSATEGQRRIITTLDAPLSVAAGAGSGKTFTLTNRIAYALVGEEGTTQPFIGRVDEVLATTFSKSGAAEMKSRIRALLRRAGSTGKQQADVLACDHISIDRSARNAYNDGRLVDLTQKEFDLVELLMRNPNRVYSREALLDAIWGYDNSSDIRTVDVHIRRLREKLERTPASPEHIMTKWGVGYYFKF